VAAQVAFQAGTVLTLMAPLAALGLATAGTLGERYVTEVRGRRRASWLNAVLEREVRDRTEDLRRTQLEVIQRLAQAAEHRDQETGQHLDRIGRLSEALSLAAGMTPAEAEELRHASVMHDVGKIGIPDAVLLKPGGFDEDDWAVMRTHTRIGAAILAGSESRVVQLGETIAMTHHERWDGSGYPIGLVAEEIPLAGRICAICDVFDALLSRRPYKEPWTLGEALAEIARQRGADFDPRLVDLFLGIAPRLYVELGYDDGATPVRQPAPAGAPAARGS
jgi:response regulator RpfG family c-di-GMP phosphodiesterase